MTSSKARQGRGRAQRAVGQRADRNVQQSTETLAWSFLFFCFLVFHASRSLGLHCLFLPVFSRVPPSTPFPALPPLSMISRQMEMK